MKVTCPDKFSILQNEIRSPFPQETNITVNGVKDLLYPNAVIGEGLRLCPKFYGPCLDEYRSEGIRYVELDYLKT